MSYFPPSIFETVSFKKSGFMASSESRNVIYIPFAMSRALFLAMPCPAFSCFITLNLKSLEYSSSIIRLESVDPSSTIITSKSLKYWERILSKHSFRNLSEL